MWCLGTAKSGETRIGKVRTAFAKAASVLWNVPLLEFRSRKQGVLRKDDWPKHVWDLQKASAVIGQPDSWKSRNEIRSVLGSTVQTKKDSDQKGFPIS